MVGVFHMFVKLLNHFISKYAIFPTPFHTTLTNIKNLYPILDKQEKDTQFHCKLSISIPIFRPKWLKKHTFWGSTPMYSLYKGVPTLPPGSGTIKSATATVSYFKWHYKIIITGTVV